MELTYGANKKKEMFKKYEFNTLNYGQKTKIKFSIFILLSEAFEVPRGYGKFCFCGVFCPNNFLEVQMFTKHNLKDFDNFLLLDKGLKYNTRMGHLRSISIVLKKLTYPTNNDFREHIIWMYEKKYSHSHIVNTIKAIEYYSEFQGNPIKIKQPRRPKKLIEHYLTEAEINCMIRNANDLRQKAMVSFLAFTGVRNQEFCNVLVKDLDFGNNQVFVRQGKFSKDRRVNMGYKCTNILVDYIIKYKKKPEEFLFTTIKNRNQYRASDLRKFINVLAKKSNIEKRTFPHIFRHSLATNLILRGADILLVKEQLGHTDIQTTMNYVQRLPIQAIKTQYDYHAPAYI